MTCSSRLFPKNPTEFDPLASLQEGLTGKALASSLESLEKAKLYFVIA
jgi:hypothetical protein